MGAVWGEGFGNIKGRSLNAMYTYASQSVHCVQGRYRLARARLAPPALPRCAYLCARMQPALQQKCSGGRGPPRLRPPPKDSQEAQLMGGGGRVGATRGWTARAGGGGAAGGGINAARRGGFARLRVRVGAASACHAKNTDENNIRSGSVGESHPNLYHWQRPNAAIFHRLPHARSWTRRVELHNLF